MGIKIENIRVVDHLTDEVMDVYLEGTLIAALRDAPHGFSADTTIDGNGMTLMPSFIDLHAHFRDPGYTHKEDLETGSKAALRGGYTVVYAMGNTKPVCDDLSKHDDIIRRSKELDLIDLFQIVAVTKGFSGIELTDISSFAGKIKFLSDDGKGILSNHVMYSACKEAAKAGIGIMVHAEDPEISPYDYRVAEDIITIRDIYLSEVTGCRVHFSHVSTKGSLEAIRIGKEKGLNISCEVTPHHMALHDDPYRVNPPIRTKQDVEALLDAILDGTVDAIATDHAPHTREDKKNGAPGMIGLETAFPIAYTTLVDSGLIELSKLSELMSYNPAKIIGIEHGEIKQGAVADLVIVDTREVHRVEESEIVSKSKNSPFIGSEFKGTVKYTLRGGKIKYNWRYGFDN